MKKLIHEIHRRSLWQVLGIYVVGGWIVLQVVDTLAGALKLPDWASPMALVLLIIGLPIVLATAFVQEGVGSSLPPAAKDAADETASDEGAVPAPEPSMSHRLLTWRNAIAGGIGVFLLLFGFAGLYVVVQDRGHSFNPLNQEPLNAATTTVTVEDTAGNTFEREIPRDEFRRSVAMFAFDNESADTAVNWIRFGLPDATQIDLYQDMFIRVVSSTGMNSNNAGMGRELREAGFEDGLGAPLALKRKLAQDRHLDVLLTGSILRAASGLVVETELYDVPRGPLIARHTTSGAAPFEVADQLSDQLKRDLELPALQLEEAEDLPVAEILTSSVSAFRSFVLGMRYDAASEMEEAETWLAGAVEEDPTFALAQIGLGEVLYFLNRPEEAANAMQAAREHMYRLPERVRLQIRTGDYLLFQQNPEMAFKTARYLIELYPQDIDGREQLANLYSMRGEWQEEVGQLEAILALDPTRYDLLQRIGGIYEKQGQHEEALVHFGRYTELFPNDHEAFVAIGRQHRLMGEHDRARSAFERALLIEPEDVSVLRAMLRLERDLGDFEKAQEWSDQALAASRGPEDLSEVYDFLETLYYRQGQFERVEETYWKLVEAQADELPVNAAFNLSQMLALQRAHEIGREAWAFGQLDSLQALMPSPFNDVHGVLYAIALAESGEVERAGIELERGKEGLASLGLEALNGWAAHATGLILEHQGDCRSAAESYKQAVSADPLLFEARAALGRCQSRLGELEKAEATFQRLLESVPADAKVRYELALVYEGLGRRANAIEQLRIATDVWKNADPDYIPAQEARTKLRELEERR